MKSRIIASFSDEYSFLSNFYKSEVILYGMTYQNAEAAFQAQKSLNLETRTKFQTLDPSKSKKLGREIPLRPDWEEIKVEVMETVIRAKFSDPTLQDKLLETGDAILIEGNTWNDIFWGKCNGIGLNMLGKTLMKIRKELKG